MNEVLHRCLVDIRKRRAAVAELAWGADGPRLGMVDADKPKWLDVDRLLEVIDQREWQPIETAPESGRFLVYMPDGALHQIQAAHYEPNFKIIGDHFAYEQSKPTHWMPLPDPPEEETNAKT